MSIEKAIEQLRPNARWVIIGEPAYSNLQWTDELQSRPTKIEVETLAAQIEEEQNNLRYRRLRAKEYPPITDYLDAVVKGDLEQQQAYIDACQAVKAKYPKPEGV
jgi:hypothetical protein